LRLLCDRDALCTLQHPTDQKMIFCEKTDQKMVIYTVTQHSKYYNTRKINSPDFSFYVES
jgi:hypothetical protein